jgi:flavin reductase (DIM6/NTAB) family NADH-FMN oxidoreductase RutF
MGVMQLPHGPSPESLKRVFGSFATGVAVIGVRGPDGAMIGMTVNSLTSVSMDPPLLLFCPSRALAAYEIYAAAQHFTVSILPKHSETISNHFSRSGIDKWGTSPHSLGASGAPYLENALGVMECAVVDRHPAGDHLIVLGRVLRMMVSTADEPLIFFRSRYMHLCSQGETTDPHGSAQIDVWG